MSQAAAKLQSDDVLVDLLDGAKDDLDTGSSRITVANLVSVLNDRGFGALCAMIGAVASIPLIGGVPGVSMLTALLVLLIAGQYVVGRDTLWIPSILAERSIERKRVDKALKTMRPYAKWLDGGIAPRLKWIVDGRTERRIMAVAMCVMALTMFPLALVPWGVFPAALAITAFGIAITGRDGLFAIAGYALLLSTVYLLYRFSGMMVGLFW